MTPAERWRQYVAVDPTPGACWLWTGGLYKRFPYGVFHLCDEKNTIRKAHIFAWELATGERVPNGLWICHTCDNPSCVRNDDVGTYIVNGVICERRGHLFLGTAKENALDKFAKGRENVPKGERAHNAKLTNADVLEIRRVCAALGNQVNYSELGRRFGVRSETIGRVARNQGWKHVV